MTHVERGITASEEEKEQVWPTVKKEDTSLYTFDPAKPLNFKFKILQDYYEKYEQLKTNGEIAKYRENIEWKYWFYLYELIWNVSYYL